MLEKIKYIANIAIIALLFATVAIQRDGKIMGKDVATIFQSDSNEYEDEDVEIETTLSDGTIVINSKPLAKDIIGFGGNTPIKLYVRNDIIEKVEYEPNSETPSFFDEVVKSGLFEKWKGMKLSDAASAKVDLVSGATYSSSSIVGNVRRAAQYGAKNGEESAKIYFFSNFGIKDICGICVIALGLFITFTKSKNRSLMTLQLILNIVVLGFWCGSFLSLSTFIAWIGNGVNLSLSLLTFLMFCVVIIVPLFGRKGTYCQLYCPMGSAQELLGRVPLKKIKIGSKLNRFLTNLRYYILSSLLLIMWFGVGFDLVNYEIFSAFIFTSASTFVLILAAIFLILSLLVHRPYCRFICPTGALITMSQKTQQR